MIQLFKEHSRESQSQRVISNVEQVNMYFVFCYISHVHGKESKEKKKIILLNEKLLESPDSGLFLY